MTFSITTSLIRGSYSQRLLLFGLTALAVPAFGLSVSRAGCIRRSESRHHCAPPSDTPNSYLLLIGPASFRFAPSPPVATPRPAAPQVIPPVAVTHAEPETQSKDNPVQTASNEKPKIGSSVMAPKELPILPDDTPRDVHPADVLPFFDLPRHDHSGASVAIPFTPAAPALPASGATYELK